MIQDYRTDTPYPSCRWLMYSHGRPIHIVFAGNQDDCERIIITVYRADPGEVCDNCGETCHDEAVTAALLSQAEQAAAGVGVGVRHFAAAA